MLALLHSALGDAYFSLQEKEELLRELMAVWAFPSTKIRVINLDVQEKRQVTESAVSSPLSP